MRPRPLPRLRPVPLGLLAVLAAACDETRFPRPRDPGVVQVRVRDDRAAPVPGAGVRVQMPNSTGSLFEVGTTTRADGTSTIDAVPAGARRVSVTPPTGYAQGADPLVRLVDVVRAETTRVDFVLRRNTP